MLNRAIRPPVKEALIALYLLGSCGTVAERVTSLGPSLSLLFYLVLLGVLLVCLLLAAYVSNPLLRCVYALILAASALFLNSYERIMSEHLTYDAFINQMNSVGFLGDALRQHGRPLAWSALLAVLLMIGIALKPRYTPPLPGRAVALAPPFGVALLAAVLFVRGGDGARGLPAPFTPLAYSSILTYETGAAPRRARQDVALRPVRPPAARDLVLIIDESVSGNYLDLAHPAGVRSGLNEPRLGIAIYNYGAAASITNCSVGTNVTLRHGGTRVDYQRINAFLPPIWAYARRAGLRTVYIDAQRTGGALHNGMSEAERATIDEFVQFDGVRIRDRDMAAADRLASFLNNETAEFVIVNKVGAHFPIHDRYPDAYRRYRPALPRGGHPEVSDTGSREGFGGRPEDWRRYRNSYRNTLLWNVGAFFDRLFARADLRRATLIYTSDHGQDLHERDNSGLNTHCSSDPVIEEGLVPLVVMEGGSLETLDWERHLPSNRNRVSHYQVFPTLLTLMGYSQAEVAALYGDTLADPSRDDFTFNSRFNARLGRQPSWVRIDLARVATPPAADAGAAGRPR